MSWFDRNFREPIRGLPVLPRHVVLGALALGFAGAVVGLVLGLLAYPPTAAFAIVEAGIPGVSVGATLGLLSGCAADLRRRVGHRRRSASDRAGRRAP